MSTSVLLNTDVKYALPQRKVNDLLFSVVKHTLHQLSYLMLVILLA